MLEQGRAALLGWTQTVQAAWQQRATAAGGAGPPPPPLPPPQGPGSPEYAAYVRRVEAYLGTLTEEQLRTVAGKDGFAAELRDQANRLLLNRDRARLSSEIAALRAKARAAVGPGGEAERLTADFRADQLQATLTKLDVVAGGIGDRKPGDDNGFFLLDYDVAGDGRTVIANHNPDTARNVATFVPGAATALDGDFRGTVDRVNELHEAATRAGSPSTSVIAWLDYDAPPLHHAGDDSYALAARQDLDAFQHGLRTSHLGERSHNTVIGHSYGALVAGIADRDQVLPIDKLVSAGGVGLGVSHADQLNIAPENVWATEATADNAGGSDDVADVGRWLALRPDPASESFGAETFESDAPVPLPSGPHSQYFDDTSGHQNPGLNNLGVIIAGGEPTRP